MTRSVMVAAAAAGAVLVLAGPASTNPRTPFPPASWEGKFGQTAAPSPQADPAPPPPPQPAVQPTADHPANPRAGEPFLPRRAAATPKQAEKTAARPTKPAAVQQARTGGQVVKVAIGGDATLDHAEIAKLASATDATVLGIDGRAALRQKSTHLAVAPALPDRTPPGAKRIAGLMDAVVVVLVRDADAKPADLTGKPIQIGAQEDDAAVARAVLKAMDVDATEERAAPQQAIEAVANGSSQAAVLVALKGSQPLKEALSEHPELRIMPMPDEAKVATTTLSPADIPGAAEDVPVAAAEIGLFTRPDGPGPRSEIVAAKLQEEAGDRREEIAQAQVAEQKRLAQEAEQSRRAEVEAAARRAAEQKQAMATDVGTQPASTDRAMEFARSVQHRRTPEMDFAAATSATANERLAQALQVKADKMRRDLQSTNQTQ